MNLRRKTVLAMTVMPIIMIVVTYFCAQFILMDNYAALEKQRAEVNVKRGLSALSNVLAELDSTVSDWAGWDDTYIFVQDINEDYIESNLVEGTFVNLGLNIMLFMNTEGEVVYGKEFNLTAMDEQRLSIVTTQSAINSAHSLTDTAATAAAIWAGSITGSAQR